MYNFEKLIAWQKSLNLINSIYKITEKLPNAERFALIDQIKRSSTSVALNLAEGSAAYSKKEFTAFCRHALKSLYETIAALKIMEMIYKIDSKYCLEQCDEESKLIHGLIKSLSAKN